MSENKTQNMFEDFSKLASGGFSTLMEAKKEIDNMIQGKVKEVFDSFDLVKKDEVEVIKETLEKILKNQEQIEKKIAKLQKK